MGDSKLAVYGALTANVAIAVTKFIVAAFTGSDIAEKFPRLAHGESKAA